MPYTPDNLTIDPWSSPVTISGTDLIRNLDEAVNTIISTDANSIKNHVNTQLDKIPPYLSSEFNKIYTGVETNATIATTKATEASASATSASTSATTATNQATIATTKASEASASASSASNSETTATTKASEANASAISASNSATSASSSANTATTKANEASASAVAALTSANNASTSEDNALLYANNAKGYADSINPSQFVDKTTAQTIGGVKTFGSFPITPSSAPIANYEVANKKYVDDKDDALKDVPQNLQNASYTLALTDRGNSVDIGLGGATVSIPLNSVVNFPVGAVITISNLTASAITIAPISGVTLRQAGTSNTGNRTLSAYGMATLRKTATDTWFISGAGLS